VQGQGLQTVPGGNKGYRGMFDGRQLPIGIFVSFGDLGLGALM
jgi:hypothetical protein